MKQIIHMQNTLILRFDLGDDVIALLNEYAIQNAISAATFSGIGAAQEVTVSYYHLDTKTYDDHQISEPVEITSLSGNIALLNDKPTIHAHGTFAKSDLSVIGGHVKKLVVSATCEIMLTVLETPVNRAPDEATGLNLLQ